MTYLLLEGCSFIGKLIQNDELYEQKLQPIDSNYRTLIKRVNNKPNQN